MRLMVPSAPHTVDVAQTSTCQLSLAHPRIKHDPIRYDFDRSILGGTHCFAIKINREQTVKTGPGAIAWTGVRTALI